MALQMLPGGYLVALGRIFEMLTWSQLGFTPVPYRNIDNQMGFYDP